MKVRRLQTLVASWVVSMAEGRLSQEDPDPSSRLHNRGDRPAEQWGQARLDGDYSHMSFVVLLFGIGVWLVSAVVFFHEVISPGSISGFDVLFSLPPAFLAAVVGVGLGWYEFSRIERGASPPASKTPTRIGFWLCVAHLAGEFLAVAYLGVRLASAL